MRRTDAAAFLITALSVLIVNAVLAVALGCSIYLVRYIVNQFRKSPQEEDLMVKVAFGAQ